MKILKVLSRFFLDHYSIHFPINNGEMEKSLNTKSQVMLTILRAFEPEMHMNYGIYTNDIFNALIEAGHIKVRKGFLNDYCEVSKNFKSVLKQYELRLLP